MGSDHGIRGILFDAGGVLIRPVGGRWNPRYDFEGIVLDHHPGIDTALFPAALAAGQRVLDAAPATPKRADYHRAMLQVLGVARPSAALLDELEGPAAGPTLDTYPDVRPVLEHLRERGIRMSVVSDTWAGLEAQFRELGIAPYFDGFVISEVLGCRKPDPRMYAAGSDLLGLDAGDCLFIDDDPDLVAAAVGLGYHGVTLRREGRADGGAITLLHDVPPIVSGAGPTR